LIESRLCTLLDIPHPIIQGGMAWVSRAELAAAVSEAGALGIIGAGLMTPDELRAEIRRIKILTSSPFGVNVILVAPHVVELIDVVLDEGVHVLTTGAGNPGALLGRIAELPPGKQPIVIPVAASVPLAVRLERMGAKAVIVEGYEAGGHIGELTTMTLTAMVTRKVSIPVIAAGGIADGRAMAAALALGAEGVQMGTVFLTAGECPISDAWKEKVLSAGDRDTVVTGRSTGHPVRMLKNRLSRMILDMEKRGAPPEEIFSLGEGRLRAAVDGDVVEGSIMSGQIAGLLESGRSAREIIEDTVREAAETVERLSRIVSHPI